ncbi:MAG: tetratricopeptide repeat protein [Bacteroidetes bacterium]|nr:tetratricopeptide repeat protein [Bacteroidota bacterium]
MLKIKITQVVFFTFLFVSKLSLISQNANTLLKRLSLEKNQDTIANLTGEIGRLYLKEGNMEKALEYLKKELELSKNIYTERHKAYCYNTIATIYARVGNTNEAISNFIRALKIAEDEKDYKLASGLYNNIGNLYVKLKMLEDALKYIHKGMELKKQIGDKNITPNLYSISNIYRTQKKYQDAIKYLNEAYKEMDTASEINGFKYKPVILNSLGACYRALGDYDKSLHYYKKCEGVLQSADFSALSSLYNNIAVLYEYKNQYRVSLSYQLKAYEMQKKMNQIEDQMVSCRNLVVYFAKLNEGDSASMYFELYIALADSVQKIQNSEMLHEVAKKYDTEKKEAQITLLAKDKELQKLLIKNQEKDLLQKQIEAKQKEDKILLLNKDVAYNEVLLQKETFEKEKKLKENEVLNIENKLSSETIKQQKLVSYFIVGGLVLALLFSFFIFRGLKAQRKANRIISKQKQEVEKQKHLVEEKNKEITDSITYAKRIQNAILPNPKKWQTLLPHSFVLYQPKDIVAGDFYWLEETAQYLYIAAADCTGHGVPGAMVSVVCSSALSKAVLEEKQTETHTILGATRRLVLEQLGKSEEKIRDGMDICLIRINKSNRKHIQYSGANRPLYISNAQGELQELKPDKQPIGQYENEKPFSQQELVLNENDTLYLLTDGYADQFGGDNNKKFSSKALKKLMTENAHKTIEEQNRIFTQSFLSWRNNIEQTDDVTLLGVRM